LVSSIQQARALGAVLALVGVDAQHFHIGAACQHFMDAQAGGAFLAVDIDLVGHDDDRQEREFKGAA
jgi:hypothetical protein